MSAFSFDSTEKSLVQLSDGPNNQTWERPAPRAASLTSALARARPSMMVITRLKFSARAFFFSRSFLLLFLFLYYGAGMSASVFFFLVQLAIQIMQIIFFILKEKKNQCK